MAEFLSFNDFMGLAGGNIREREEMLRRQLAEADAEALALGDWMEERFTDDNAVPGQTRLSQLGAYSSFVDAQGRARQAYQTLRTQSRSGLEAAVRDSVGPAPGLRDYAALESDIQGRVDTRVNARNTQRAGTQRAIDEEAARQREAAKRERARKRAQEELRGVYYGDPGQEQANDPFFDFRENRIDATEYGRRKGFYDRLQGGMTVQELIREREQAFYDEDKEA